MVIPTAADVRLWSKVDWIELDYPEGATPDPLQVLVDRAVGYVQGVTGRLFASWTDLALQPIAEQAIQLRTEQLAFESQHDYAETAADDVVQSFSASNYSETRVDPMKRAQMHTLNANPALERALWLVMTPEMQEYWYAVLSGKNAPAFDVTEIDWTGNAFGPYEPVPGAWFGFGNPDGID